MSLILDRSVPAASVDGLNFRRADGSIHERSRSSGCKCCSPDVSAVSCVFKCDFEIAVSAGNTSVSVSANSSIGVAAVLNLPENETTTLSLTFTPGQIASHLDIGNITISVIDNSSLPSILPTQTLPPTVSLPSFISSTTTVSSTSSSPTNTSNSQSSDSSHKQLVADAVD
ncbi:hypothetical protein DFJ43DRAFT_1151741 [Lentinula guzmanii]|uniref:Uncharacterized protein n=1 Tax=Lentinula guzmanii TaxID=2804957 RepID=A0AA38JR77_9AGAR|nr:hypothetical protein DFJ43DRAFT_1151741 [Lentinula guzmanii]